MNGKKTAADEFPEFRAWRAMLKPLVGIEPPKWTEPLPTLLTVVSMDEDAHEQEEETEE